MTRISQIKAGKPWSIRAICVIRGKRIGNLRRRTRACSGIVNGAWKEITETQHCSVLHSSRFVFGCEESSKAGLPQKSTRTDGPFLCLLVFFVAISSVNWVWLRLRRAGSHSDACGCGVGRVRRSVTRLKPSSVAVLRAMLTLPSRFALWSSAFFGLKSVSET